MVLVTRMSPIGNSPVTGLYVCTVAHIAMTVLSYIAEQYEVILLVVILVILPLSLYQQCVVANSLCRIRSIYYLD